MLRAIVLGAAAGGGVPQWNCNCDNCREARTGRSRQATQASVAVTCDDRHWFLINASPDIREQINATPALHPQGTSLRHSPISGVFLTNGEVDAVAGLLSLREGTPFSIYAHRKVLSVLAENSIFNVLRPETVARYAVEVEKTFEPHLPDGRPSGLEVTAFVVPGKPAWYLEGTESARPEEEGDTIALHIKAQDGGELFFIAACGEITPALASRLEGAPLVFFDGTLWRDDEMISSGLSQKTGRRMGHISMSGEDGAMAGLSRLKIGQKVFLHINNSNPVLRPGSDERYRAEEAGWQIGRDGMEFRL